MGSFFPIHRGFSRRFFRASPAGLPTLTLVVAALSGGCQSSGPASGHRLIEHQAMIDFSGLKPAEVQRYLNVTAAVPKAWQQVGPMRNALYTHTQWRGPSGHTAVGAAYIRMPLPVNADIMLFIAQQEYARKSNDGRILSRWTDALGREWFEAENNKYHVQGYAIAQGFEGWFIYFGYKVTEPPEMSEISLAARSADSFVPNASGTPAPAATQPASQPAMGASPLRLLRHVYLPQPQPATMPAQ